MKKVYWAKNEKEFLDFLTQALSKHYNNQMEVLRWLDRQSLKVEVWKN